MQCVPWDVQGEAGGHEEDMEFARVRNAVLSASGGGLLDLPQGRVWH